MFIKKIKRTISVKLLKIFSIIVIGIFLNTNAYSKVFKTKAIYESEYGGIYAFKNPVFSAKKGSYIDTFREILDLSEKNCSNYSKHSFFFTKLITQRTFTSSVILIELNGDLKEWGLGYIPDDTTAVKLMWTHFRIYCGENIGEVLVSHSFRNTIFPRKFFHIEEFKLPDRVGDSDSIYAVYKNKQLVLNFVTNENRENIVLKLKETNKDRTAKLKTKHGFAKTNIGYKDYSDIILKAKATCKDLGFKQDSEKFSGCVLDLTEVSDSYEAAKLQENILIAKAKEQENIEVEFNYETSSGQKITKESKWTKFWQGAAWILYEYGDEIFAVILDLKYDTNYSGLNTTNQVSTNRGGLRCVSQRAGTVVHQHCKGAGGTHIYCMYQSVGKKFVKRTCRDKST